MKGTGPWRRGFEVGRAETTIKSECFSGSYGWTTWVAPVRVTVSATPQDYVIPIFNWTVNGQAYAGGFQTITVQSKPYLDPLHLITDVAPVSVPLTVSGGGNSIAIDLPATAPGVSLDIVCSVSEWNVPDGYDLTRQDEVVVDAAGTVRIMDQRFQNDFARCVQMAQNLARKLYREQVLPQIDLGDPPPPWVERQLAAISVELREDQREGEFLAHFIEDPALAAHLRALTRSLTGVIGMSRLFGQTQGRTVSEPA